MEMITIVVVDDHQMIRYGVRKIFDKVENIEVLGAAQDSDSAIALVHETHPSVVVVDITLAGISGIDLISYLKAESPASKMVMYTMHATADYVFRAVDAGAKGYVLKTDSPEILQKAITNAHRDRLFLSPSLPPEIEIRLLTSGGSAGKLSLNLTRREAEIANLLAQGFNPDRIGKMLYISPRTVRVHRTNIMHKFNCTNVSKLLLILREHFPQEG
ncbi:MAG: response regulator transcription factor [Thermodesulfobacteriota bacterium]